MIKVKNIRPYPISCIVGKQRYAFTEGEERWVPDTFLGRHRGSLICLEKAIGEKLLNRRSKEITDAIGKTYKTTIKRRINPSGKRLPMMSDILCIAGLDIFTKDGRFLFKKKLKEMKLIRKTK